MKPLAVLGLGRSGVSVAKAALKSGLDPLVVDEKPPGDLKADEAAKELKALGVEVRQGWDGSFRDLDAEAVVTSPGVPMRHPELLRAVEEGIEVQSEVEFAYHIARAPIVAITGTNGKSTTTVMTWLCARAAGLDAVLCGNIYGSGFEEIPLTEAAAASHPNQVLVAEISSFQLEWVRDFRPRAATITNITPDHLNRYASFEEYAGTKRRIFDRMGASDAAVWHSGDPATGFGRRASGVPDRTSPPNPPPRFALQSGEGGVFEGHFAPQSGEGGPTHAPAAPSVEAGFRHASPAPTAEAPGPRILAYGSPGDDAYETADDLYILGAKISKGSLPFHEPHNYLNAMAASLLAASVRSAAAWPPHSDSIKKLLDGLRQFRGLSHRMETVGEKGGVKVVNNSMCTNPGAVIASSIAIPGRQHLLIGGINKELDFGPLRGYLSESGHAVYLYGADAKGIDAALGGGLPVFNSMDEAFASASRAARSGETIMLSPGAASMDQFEDFRARGLAFVELAREWLFG